MHIHDLKENVDAFAGVAGNRTTITRMDRDGEPSILTTEMVTGVYLPLAMMDAVEALEGQLDRRSSRALFLKARLAPGVGVERANQALKDEGRSHRSGKGLSMRGGLVVARVAFCFVLLIAAGLFVRSFQKARGIDPGFDTGPAAIVTCDTSRSPPGCPWASSS